MLEDLSRGGMEKEQQLKTLSQEKSELAQKSSRLEAELEELTAARDSLGQEKSELAQKNSRLEAKLEELTAVRDSLGQEKSELAQKSSRLEAEVESLRSRFGGYQKMVQELQGESMGLLRQRVARLRTGQQDECMDSRLEALR